MPATADIDPASWQVAVLPPPKRFARSKALGFVRIDGEASRYEVSDPGTDRESHFLPAAEAVLWTARLR